MRQEIRSETKKLEQQFDVSLCISGEKDDIQKNMQILCFLNALKWGGDPNKVPPRT